MHTNHKHTFCTLTILAANNYTDSFPIEVDTCTNERQQDDEGTQQYSTVLRWNID